ncbi:MAG: NADH-quinone oxidoreductase subunit J [Alphaproteobacteria bacterium]|nr:NADH-quinone oxidoreductase subunit J [Alphaproteobacteria bacterium]
MIPALAFYFFATILVCSATLVIFARNPVHAVLFLILGFFNAACLFVLLGAEFLAFIVAIVYVGAVAVLFLFVVMMLEISFDTAREKARRYLPVGLAVGGVLLAELIFLFAGWHTAPGAVVSAANVTEETGALTNTEMLGRILYTEYVYPFQLAGLILLVAMIGAIVLSLRTRSGVRKQSVADQVARKREDVVEIVKVTPGTGV